MWVRVERERMGRVEEGWRRVRGGGRGIRRRSNVRWRDGGDNIHT